MQTCTVFGDDANSITSGELGDLELMYAMNNLIKKELTEIPN